MLFDTKSASSLFLTLLSISVHFTHISIMLNTNTMKQSPTPTPRLPSLSSNSSCCCDRDYCHARAQWQNDIQELKNDMHELKSDAHVVAGKRLHTLVTCLLANACVPSYRYCTRAFEREWRTCQEYKKAQCHGMYHDWNLYEYWSFSCHKAA